MALIEAPTRYWSATEIHRIVEAARSAPRWGARSPWVLEFRGRNVLVREVSGRDHHADDRLLACGAVLTNVRLALRTSGWAVTTRFVTDPASLDRVAEVSAGDALSPTTAEADQYAVLNGFRPARAMKAAGAIASATWCAGVELRPVPTGDRDEFLVVTTDDARLDRVRAGAAAQSARLAAMAMGRTVSAMVNLSRPPEVRAGLIERLMLAGYPQVLLRVDRECTT